MELRDAFAAAEAEEIARAIAEVEAMERQEAEEREREAERLRAERRKEEEELRRLEQQRLEEEERKRLEKEAEEKEYRRVLRISVDEQIEELQRAFGELMRSQQQALDSKHLLAEQAQKTAHEEETTKQQESNIDLVAKMEANIKKRTESIGEKQKSELTAFQKEQEQAEDEMFLQIQLHLQGKPNKELREQRLRDELTKQREQKLEAINNRFRSQLEALRQNAAIELNVLKQASERKLAEIETRYEKELRGLAATVTTDRAWFEFLLERRRNMISANRRLLLEDVESNQDVVGITAESAMKIGPFAIPEPSPAPSIAESPSTSFVELATESERLLNTLSPDQSPSSEGAASVYKNQAWDFMTLSNALESTGPIPSWPALRNQQRSGLARQSFPNARYPAYHDYKMSGALSPLDEKSMLSLSYRRPSRQQPNDSPPPPLPSIPKLYLPDEAQHAQSSAGPTQQPQSSRQSENPQPNSATEAVSPISPIAGESARLHEEPDHKFIVLPALSVHSRQSSSDSSGNMTNYSSSTSMSSLDSGSASASTQRNQHQHQRNTSAPASASSAASSPLNPALKTQRSRMWSFRSLGAGGRTDADRYTEEEIRERMKRTVGDAFGA